MELEDPEFGFAGPRGVNQSISSATLNQVISEMKGRIKVLEKQLASVSNNKDQNEAINNSASDFVNDARTINESDPRNGLSQPEYIPQAREKPWYDFMNKYSDEKEEPAIEVLAGEPAHDQTSNPPQMFPQRGLKHNNSVHESRTDVDVRPSEYIGYKAPEIPERIRINSPYILSYLASIDRNVDAARPIVMLRPFKLLVDREDDIRASVRRLEDELNGLNMRDSADRFAELSTTEPSSEAHEPMNPQILEESS